MDYPKRKLHRLKSWDYSAPGYYFVTICAKDMRCVFSRIESTPNGATVHLTRIGEIADACWKRMSKVAPHIKTDYYCIMPNHIHGIIVIEDHPKEASRSVPDLIHAYKSAVTREVNRIVPVDRKNQLWHVSYYDEIIRNDAVLLKTRQYIEDNPRKWAEDELYTT